MLRMLDLPGAFKLQDGRIEWRFTSYKEEEFKKIRNFIRSLQETFQLENTVDPKIMETVLQQQEAKTSRSSNLAWFELDHKYQVLSHQNQRKSGHLEDDGRNNNHDNSVIAQIIKLIYFEYPNQLFLQWFILYLFLHFSMHNFKISESDAPPIWTMDD